MDNISDYSPIEISKKQTKKQAKNTAYLQILHLEKQKILWANY